MRVRLRDSPSAQELSAMYVEPHDARRYGYGHGLRVAMTIDLGRWLAEGAESIADLSCGNGEIANALSVNDARMILGDFAPGYKLVGPMESTIGLIPHVDLFVCSETLEHLEDPDSMLFKIRKKAGRLLLSTPIGETDDDNVEHLWGWDQLGVAEMLAAAGWTSVARVDLLLVDTYSYQIWACR